MTQHMADARNRKRRSARAELVAFAACAVLAAMSCAAPVAPPIPTGPASTNRTPATPGASSTAVASAEVPPIDACDLVETEEIDEALGLLDLPFEERGALSFGGGEQCSWQQDADSGPVPGRKFEVAPGRPEDFGASPTLDGVAGQPVDEIGRAAVWFDNGQSGAGVLGVGDETSFGYLFVRFGIERSDLDGAARLEVAKTLARHVLPRFPGMTAAVPSPTATTSEIRHSPPDQSADSLVDNLLAKEQAGEWSREDGLILTLKLLAGEADAGSVLRESDIASPEATGILQMAQQYVEAGPDAVTRSELSRLLDLLVYTNAELEAMAGIVPPTASLAGVPIAQNGGAIEDCTQFFSGYQPSVGVGSCLEWRPGTVGGDMEAGKYRIFIPAPGQPQGGWGESDYDTALTVLEYVVGVYLGLDGGPWQMPKVNLIFSVKPSLDEAYAETVMPPNDACAVTVFPDAQVLSTTDFQQVIAHELAHCFTDQNFPIPSSYPYEQTKWWVEGVADYLSNVAYETNNLEWSAVKRLESHELATSVFVGRAYSNSSFFQQLYWDIGNAGVLRLIGSLPAAPTKEQQAAVAQYPDMPSLYHGFVRAMTDAQLRDTGGGVIDYRPQADEITVSGHHIIFELPLPYGVARLHLLAQGGDYLCVQHEEQGELRLAWRPGAPAQTGEWSDGVADVLPGESTVIASTVEDGAQFTIEVTRVVDQPDDCLQTPEPGGGGPGSCLIKICPPSAYYQRLESPPPAFH
jgi:hypothetical protein